MPSTDSSSCHFMSSMEAAQSSVVAKPWLNFEELVIFSTNSAGITSPSSLMAYSDSRSGWKAQFSFICENTSTKSRATLVPLTEGYVHCDSIP